MTKCITFSIAVVAMSLKASGLYAAGGDQAVSDGVIAEQRAALAAATEGVGVGPQAPRDIGVSDGQNARRFGMAPPASEMMLCDIHFHENAEHKGGEFTTFAGNGDGHGYGTGFKYDGTLSEAELKPTDVKIGESKHGDLVPGDTIEIHFVFSTAKATLGNSLNTCFTEAITNPHLRVEAVVGVLVNDTNAVDFTELAMIKMVDGLNHVPNLPDNLGSPVTYAGSTTGPGFNEAASPFQVTWNVRPNVVKIDIASVGVWLSDNAFEEKNAHGVRNLVTNPALLSKIN